MLWELINSSLKSSVKMLDFFYRITILNAGFLPLRKQKGKRMNRKGRNKKKQMIYPGHTWRWDTSLNQTAYSVRLRFFSTEAEATGPFWRGGACKDQRNKGYKVRHISALRYFISPLTGKNHPCSQETRYYTCQLDEHQVTD